MSTVPFSIKEIKKHWDHESRRNVWLPWKGAYMKGVIHFIKEAQEEGDYDKWRAFLAQGENHFTASLGQGNFTKLDLKEIEKNWDWFKPQLKKLSGNQSTPNFQLYKDIKDKLINDCCIAKYKKWAASNKLIASLQPNLLCTVVTEKYLNYLIKHLKNGNVKLEKEESKKILNGKDIRKDWFTKSNGILNIYKIEYGYELEKNNDAYKEIFMLPWLTIMWLEENEL